MTARVLRCLRRPPRSLPPEVMARIEYYTTSAAPLRGPMRWTPPSRAREAIIMLHPEVIAELRELLFEDDMRGVGYSEFIRRAVKLARGEEA